MTHAPARAGWGPALLLLLLALVLAGLGAWQVQRLGWKTRLIAQTQAAVRAAPADPTTLPAGDVAGLLYRRLAMTGHFIPATATLVTGTSELGSGYWELVPLRGDDGRTIMINRGFLPQGSRIAEARHDIPTGQVRVEGLLRLTEPGGTLLRANQPGADRWYSRDIAAIAARRGVVADPRLFIDTWIETPLPTGPAPRSPARSGTVPVPGLTIIAFPNNHLGYAVTWFAMSLMALAGAFVLLRRP